MRYYIPAIWEAYVEIPILNFRIELRIRPYNYISHLDRFFLDMIQRGGGSDGNWLILMAKEGRPNY